MKCLNCGFEAKDNEIMCRNCHKELNKEMVDININDSFVKKLKTIHIWRVLFICLVIIVIVLFVVVRPLVNNYVKNIRTTTIISSVDNLINSINYHEALVSMNNLNNSFVDNNYINSDKIDDIKNIVNISNLEYINLYVINNRIDNGCIIIENYIVRIKNGDIVKDSVKYDIKVKECYN